MKKDPLELALVIIFIFVIVTFLAALVQIATKDKNDSYHQIKSYQQECLATELFTSDECFVIAINRTHK